MRAECLTLNRPQAHAARRSRSSTAGLVLALAVLSAQGSACGTRPTAPGDDGAVPFVDGAVLPIDGASAVQFCALKNPCEPYWCGCGVCDPVAIVCVTPTWASRNQCRVTCPFTCAQLQTTRCECRDGRCRSLPPDAGPDCADRQDCLTDGGCADPGRVCCPVGGPLQACVLSTACCCWQCR